MSRSRFQNEEMHVPAHRGWRSTHGLSAASPVEEMLANADRRSEEARKSSWREAAALPTVTGASRTRTGGLLGAIRVQVGNGKA